MNIKEILELKTFSDILKQLSKDPVDRDIDKWQEQYDGIHAVLKREDKMVGTKGKKKLAKVAKEVITLQKKIVSMAVSFLFGDPPKLVLNEGDEEAFKLLTDTWRKNKLDYFNRKLARKIFTETKAAELWYVLKEEGKEARIRVMLLCKKNGDEIYAHFNDYGDMDAFTRKYNLEDETGKIRERADIYTATKIIHAVKKQRWYLTEEANLFEKIPVIYYSQDIPEWDDVQTEIDRLEDMISKFADTNDYFGSPILKLKGDVENAPTKEEVGKVLRITGEPDKDGLIKYEGDAEYLVWEQAPDAIKLEYDILKDIIYSMTSTPDLNFNNVKGISVLSGIAIKLMFSDSILKAKDKEELFGEGLTRRVNLLKAILSTTSTKNATKLEEMDVSIEFGSILPTDVTELIKSLSLARGGESVMSEETAVRQNPLVPDADADLEKMEEEKTKASSLGETYEV